MNEYAKCTKHLRRGDLAKGGWGERGEEGS